MPAEGHEHVQQTTPVRMWLRNGAARPHRLGVVPAQRTSQLQLSLVVAGHEHDLFNR